MATRDQGFFPFKEKSEIYYNSWNWFDARCDAASSSSQILSSVRNGTYSWSSRLSATVLSANHGRDDFRRSG